MRWALGMRRGAWALALGLMACSGGATPDRAAAPSAGNPPAGDDGRAPAGGGSPGTSGPDASFSLTRDWNAHPAIVERGAFATLYAVSDVHGAYDLFVSLLAQWGLIAPSPSAPSAAQWTGGDATLVVVGDLIDKGPASLEVIDLLRALEPQASAAGGALVVTVGNHEAEFFTDPSNAKASGSEGIDAELAQRGVAPATFIAGPAGEWLADRPFAARVAGWFFAHAGDTHGRSTVALRADLERAFDDRGLAADEFVGPTSLLESRGWYGSTPDLAASYAQALGVAHIVFGHDPNAIGARGHVGMLGPALFRIDCGIAAGDSLGVLLRIRHDGAADVAEELRAGGTVHELWRGAP